MNSKMITNGDTSLMGYQEEMGLFQDFNNVILDIIHHGLHELSYRDDPLYI